MHPPTTARPGAFTLIEIMLAMAIMAVICGTIYQFTGTTVRVANVATGIDTRAQSLGGLRRLLAAQFAALPSGESQPLIGAAGDGKDGRRDTVQMRCLAGNNMLTPDARGPYAVTLEVRNLSGDKGPASLVLNREPWMTDAEKAAGGTSGAFQLPAVSAGGVRTSGAGGLSGSRPAGWVRLLDGVRSLELSYFDPRLNAWIDKWNDPAMTPALVRVRLAMEDGGAPYEFVEKVPGGGVPRLPANLISANIPGLPPGLSVPAGVPGGIAGNKGAAGRPPTAPPPGAPPTLPAGLRPPSGPPPVFNPGGALMAPDTGTGLPPGFTR